ncbi:hypothetical protein RUM43_014478 [Polyplax serrata]|uniref:Ubiquitin carboxyl-terminal hydrolase MINDY n=1 Tax=Polyplax serrata TaxID=468196 RepID=A0AAN8NQL3_POLSC
MEDEAGSSFDPRITEVCNILWGNNVTNEIFQRWSQGFVFSRDEPTALVQKAGGPCAVIAPMQAFVLKYVNSVNHMRSIKEDEILKILVQAATDILKQTCKNNTNYFLFRRKKNRQVLNKLESENDEDSGGGGGGGGVGGATIENEKVDDISPQILDLHNISFIKFHENIEIVRKTGIEQVFREYSDDVTSYLTCSFGVLLFLYSVMLTRGLDELKDELADPTDSLIENTFGYGSQSLINLMLTGRAVSHVWDHEHDIGGLKLKGLDKQSSVGFLTLLEHLQLCEVGSFFKNPEHPIWVLGSDTHLTVLFSFEKQLVGKETPWEEARRVFKTFDCEGNNFIAVKNLGPLLQALGLVCEDDYVEIMEKKLDSENLGIILLKDFMDEFFPEEKKSTPDTFAVWHYNGLAKSSPDNKVRYHRGNAIILECNVRYVLESNSMLTVLQTKWPSIDVQWESNYTPSLN